MTQIPAGSGLNRDLRPTQILGLISILVGHALHPRDDNRLAPGSGFVGLKIGSCVFVVGEKTVGLRQQQNRKATLVVDPEP